MDQVMAVLNDNSPCNWVGGIHPFDSIALPTGNFSWSRWNGSVQLRLLPFGWRATKMQRPSSSVTWMWPWNVQRYCAHESTNLWQHRKHKSSQVRARSAHAVFNSTVRDGNRLQVPVVALSRNWTEIRSPLTVTESVLEKMLIGYLISRVELFLIYRKVYTDTILI